MKSQMQIGERQIATLPTFIGIGPPKCATTWLDAVLREHPEIFLPKNQKEVFFFDRFFDRGVEWYLNLFSVAEGYPAIGEISTSYILSEKTLQRIYEFNPDIRIICILRHPIERMVSQYRMFVENGRTTRDFAAAIEEHSILKDYSSYARLLASVLDIFPRSNLHIGIYEEIFAGGESKKEYISSLLKFLGVDPALLDRSRSERRIRTTYGQPKSLWLVKKAKAVRRSLRERDLEKVVQLAARFGIDRRLFLKPTEMPAIPEAVRTRLLREFEKDIVAVETFLGRRIDAWRE